MIKFYLDGQECDPKNRQEIIYQSNRAERNRAFGIELSTQILTFVKKDRQRILNYIANNGYSVGMPFEIHFSGGIIQRYVLDFLDEAFRKNSYEVSVRLIRRNFTEHFLLDADSLTFERVNFVDADFRRVDFQVIPQNQQLTLVALQLMALNTTIAIIDSIQEVAEGVTDVINASTPSISAVGVPVINVPLIITASLKLLARTAKLIALSVAFFNTMRDIINIVAPPIRQFRGINLKRLIEKSCQFLGYQLQSNFLDQFAKDIVLLPVPIMNTDAGILKQIFIPNTLAFTKGYPSFQDQYQTLGQVLTQLKTIFNLQDEVEDGVYRLEPQAVFQSANNSPVKLFYNDQQNLTEERTHNGDYYKRRFLTFTTDPMDLYTFDDAKGLSAENGLEAIAQPSFDLNLLRGLDNLATGYAKGSRRTELTFVEKFLQGVARLVDRLTSKSLSNTITNRANCLQISELYFSVTKMLWMNGTRLAPENETKLNARYILETFHDDDDFAEVIENLPVPMTESDFLFFATKEFVILQSGEIARVQMLRWSEETHIAEFTLELINQDKLKANVIRFD